MCEPKCNEILCRFVDIVKMEFIGFSILAVKVLVRRLEKKNVKVIRGWS